ncbi:MAG: transposase [Magnetococcales bacterium]|nr:transposase [Magnetococcales bacterium]
MFLVLSSRLPPVVAATKTIKNHQDDVLDWFVSGLITGLVEGFNSLLQAAKARSRSLSLGYQLQSPWPASSRAS